MKLYVTRHGQTQYNIEVRICGHSDVCLTEKGIKQAEVLADSMIGKGVDLIISSPLVRANTTANMVSAKIGAPVITDDRLKERDYGAIDGTYEGTPGFMDNWIQFGYVYPDGESLLQVVQRVYNLLDEIKDKYSDKTVMIISHGGVCRVINSYFKSLSNDKFFEFNLDNCKVLEYTL